MQALRFLDLTDALIHSEPAAAKAATALRTWDITMPADLESRPHSQPFTEPLRGLCMREVREPDVFQRFFGYWMA